jgi:hypothetical protein
VAVSARGEFAAGKIRSKPESPWLVLQMAAAL